MGEKGSLAPDAMAALDAIPVDLLKSSPETINAWLDTYLKTREVRDRHAAEAAAEVAELAKPEADEPSTSA